MDEAVSMHRECGPCPSLPWDSHRRLLPSAVRDVLTRLRPAHFCQLVFATNCNGLYTPCRQPVNRRSAGYLSASTTVGRHLEGTGMFPRKGRGAERNCRMFSRFQIVIKLITNDDSARGVYFFLFAFLTAVDFLVDGRAFLGVGGSESMALDALVTAFCAAWSIARMSGFAAVYRSETSVINALIFSSRLIALCAFMIAPCGWAGLTLRNQDSAYCGR